MKKTLYAIILVLVCSCSTTERIYTQPKKEEIEIDLSFLKCESYSFSWFSDITEKQKEELTIYEYLAENEGNNYKILSECQGEIRYLIDLINYIK